MERARKKRTYLTRSYVEFEYPMRKSMDISNKMDTSSIQKEYTVRDTNTE